MVSEVNAQPNFFITCRVYWEDADGGGVVYYANYLKYLERCRTEWLRALGIDQWRLRTERTLQFAVVSVNIKYLRPARLDDELCVSASLVRFMPASICFDQGIRRGGEPLIDASIRVACLDAVTLKPRPIPADLFKEWRHEQ